MRNQVIANAILFALLLLVPLVVHYATMESREVPGTGLDLLFYKPFDFAYFLLAWGLFVGVNLWAVTVRDRLSPRTAAVTVATSSIVAVIWFIVSFLAVGQLHLALGGKL